MVKVAKGVCHLAGKRGMVGIERLKFYSHKSRISNYKFTKYPF